MQEMRKRGYNPDHIWDNVNWRGSNLGEIEDWCDDTYVQSICTQALLQNIIIYSEHDNKYLLECIENLEGKGIDTTQMRKELL